MSDETTTPDTAGPRGCHGTNAAGEPCGAPAIEGGDYCAMHADPKRARELGRRGGYRRGMASAPWTWTLPDNPGPDDWKRAREAAARAALAGELDEDRAATLSRLLVGLAPDATPTAALPGANATDEDWGRWFDALPEAVWHAYYRWGGRLAWVMPAERRNRLVTTFIENLRARGEVYELLSTGELEGILIDRAKGGEDAAVTSLAMYVSWAVREDARIRAEVVKYLSGAHRIQSWPGARQRPLSVDLVLATIAGVDNPPGSQNDRGPWIIEDEAREIALALSQRFGWTVDDDDPPPQLADERARSIAGDSQ